MRQSQDNIDQQVAIDEQAEEFYETHPRIFPDPKMKNRILNLDLVEELAAQGLNSEQTGMAMGYSKATWNRRLQSISVLKIAYEIGKAKGIQTVTNALFENAKKGNLGAQCFYLKNRAGWKDKHEIDVDQTTTYLMQGAPVAEDTDSWVSQYRPSIPAPQTRQ